MSQLRQSGQSVAPRSFLAYVKPSNSSPNNRRKGWSAVSLDRVLPVTSPYFLAGSENAADAAIQKALVDAFRPYKHTAHDVMRSSPALGMVVSVCVVGYIRVPWQPTSETVILFLPRDDDLPEEEETVKKIVGVLRSPSA